MPHLRRAGFCRLRVKVVSARSQVTYGYDYDRLIWESSCVYRSSSGVSGCFCALRVEGLGFYRFLGFGA